MEKVSRAVMPFLVANVVVVLLVTYVPKITLFVPSLFR
jgi:TRAP-type C4-dicarboxylate transport system permease large subunit